MGDVPFEDPRFRRVFAADAVSMLGTSIAPVALVFAVLSISDAAGVGLVLAARTLPEVALLLGAGVVGDRRSPRSILIAADAARACSWWRSGPAGAWRPDAASFAASALLLASVALDARPRLASRRLVADLRDGWRVFRSIDWLWRGVLTMSLWNGAWAAYGCSGRWSPRSRPCGRR